MGLTLKVDYDTPLERSIDLGLFTAVNVGVTDAHYPPTRTGTALITVDMVTLDRTVAIAEALTAIRSAGCQPADIRELIAAVRSTQLPDGLYLSLGSQRYYPLGYWLSPSVQVAGENSVLGVQRLDRTFASHCVFAGVRHETS